MSRRLPASSRIRSHLSVEPLEMRILPTVSASVTHGTLNLFGDSSANDITIAKSGADLVLTGNGGTQIRFNGVTGGSATISGVTNLKGLFLSQDDTITFTNGVSLGNVSLALGGGTNLLDLGNTTITGKLLVAGGNGDDTVAFNDANLNSAVMTLFDGDNEVDFAGTTANGAVIIKTGSGIDTITSGIGTGGIDNNFRGAFTLNTCHGGDSIVLANATFANLSINSEADDDTVTLDTVTVNGRLFLLGGVGDDAITLNAVVQNGTSANVISGMAGVDTLRLKGATFNSAVSVDLGTGTANQLEVDDVQFVKAASFLSTGLSDVVSIEQDLTQTGSTIFSGATSFQLGTGATLDVGTNDIVASYTTFSTKLSIKGATPNVIATFLMTRIDLPALPLLKNTQFDQI